MGESLGHMQKAQLDDDIAQAVQAYLSALSHERKIEVFGTSDVRMAAFQGNDLYCLVVGTEDDVAACEERARRTGAAFPGIRAVDSESGSVYVAPHKGAFWVEGGGTIAGGLTLVGVAPGSEVGFQNITFRRGGARGYQVRWAVVVHTEKTHTSSTLLEQVKPYLR